jgi:hypothetical protein
VNRGNGRDLVRINSLEEFVIHHANWRTTAAGKAFDEFDAVFAVWADRNRSVHPADVVGAIDIRQGGQLFHQRIGARHGTA